MKRFYLFAIAGAITCSANLFPLNQVAAVQEDNPLSDGGKENVYQAKPDEYDSTGDQALPGGAVVSEILRRIQHELNTGKLSQESVNQVAQLAEKYKDNFKTHLYYGLCLDEVGLPDEALAQFKLADQLGPRDPRGTVGILNHLLARGDQHAANLLLDEALKRFPNTPEINYFLGSVLKENGRYAEAEKVFTRAYREGHHIFRLPTELGELMQSKNPHLAIKLADEDLAQHPDYYRALQVKGVALMNLGAFALAVDPFRKLFEKDPAYGRFAEYYVRCLYWSGDYKNAVMPGLYYLAQQAQEPGGETPVEDVLVKLFRSGSADTDAKKIEQFYAAIAKSSPSVQAMVKPAFHFYLARCLERVPRAELAISEWQKYLASEPNSIAALYHLGLLMENHRHDYGEAQKLYSRAHGLAPHDEQINDAFERMQAKVSSPSASGWAQSVRDWLRK